MPLISLTLVLLTLSSFQVFSLNNGLGLTPQMGWNSWNHYGCSINEDLIKATADALIATGLADLGYRYVNLDDCWQIARDPNGVIIPDPAAFPSGIQALADYMHERNLFLGVYSDAGLETCQGRPGSLGYETIDANTYAAWEVDYLKYDNCYDDGIIPELRYPIMRNALNATGRKIFFSMCEWGVDNPATWAPNVGNSWRTTGDIQDTWISMLFNLESQVGLAQYAGPGGWNDPDMLEVGNGGMTYEEYLSHFALWCVLKAPLIIGCDVTSITNETLSILSNPWLIAVNQDPLGVEGIRVNHTGLLEVWGGPLSNNSYVAVLFNIGEVPANITAWWNDLNVSYSNASVFDLVNGVPLGYADGSYTASVNVHSVVAIKISPVTAEELVETQMLGLIV